MTTKQSNKHKQKRKRLSTARFWELAAKAWEYAPKLWKYVARTGDSLKIFACWFFELMLSVTAIAIFATGARAVLQAEPWCGFGLIAGAILIQLASVWMDSLSVAASTGGESIPSERPGS